MTSYPPPFSVKASGNYRGDFGLFSTFLLSVGSPFTPIEVTVSTAQALVYTVGEGGCTTNETVIPNCAAARGGQFNALTSSSFMTIVPANARGLNLAYSDYFPDLGTGGTSEVGDYGYDSLQFTASNGTSVSLSNQFIVNYNTTDFWTGFMGLSNIKPSILNNNQAGLIVGMKNAGYIGSQSFSYTAGQSYNSAVGSLVLGGFDASIASFKGNSFVFSVDNTRPLLSGLLAITFSNGNGGTTVPLLQNSISVNIDTTLEQLWLPQAACTAFANAFGLYQDSATTLYFLNSTQHAANVAANPSVTFTIAESVNSQTVNNITLGYNAFDMNFTNPGTGITTYAFPIRVASSANDYVLGNTLLQNSVLSVDYERGNYTIESLQPGTRGSPTLIPTLSTSVSSNPYPVGQGTSGSPSSSNSPTSTSTPSSGGGSNAGAIAGGVVGGVVALILIGLLLWFLKRRRNAHRDSMPPPAYETVPTTEPKNHGAELGTQQGTQTNTIPSSYFQKPLPGVAGAGGAAAAAAAASGMNKEHTSELPSPDNKPGSPASGISQGPSAFPFPTGDAVELPAGEHTSEMAAPEATGGFVSRSGAVSPAFSAQSHQHHKGSFGSHSQGPHLEPMSPVSAMGRTSMDRQAGMSSTGMSSAAGPSVPSGANMQAGGNRNSDIDGIESIGSFPGPLRRG